MRNYVSVYQTRVLAFEYMLKKLIEWYAEIKQTENNDLSILKSIKLLFFVSAVNAKRGNPNHLLTQVFTDFVAMPYGHVESKIYDEIKERNGVLNYFTITNRKSNKIDQVNLEVLNEQIDALTRAEIDRSIQSLKKRNSEFIALSAFDLVDLSHTYYSWKKTYSDAQLMGVNSLEIPVEDIIQEDKSFNLQMF